MAGSFVRTGFDYRGEPTPFGWPGREGAEIDVWVHSNCQTVELFLNGKPLGEGEMTPNSHLEWKVEYAPRKLLGVGNGDPSSHGSDQGARRSAFHGLCLAIVQASRATGAITIKADSPGLRSAMMSIEAR